MNHISLEASLGFRRPCLKTKTKGRLTLAGIHHVVETAQTLFGGDFIWHHLILPWTNIKRKCPLYEPRVSQGSWSEDVYNENGSG